MSYAGTYGADETCRHDTYWRSCSLCSLVGPRATGAEIALRLAQDEARRQRAIEAEATRRAMYRALDDDERIVAEALWKRFLEAYPGLGRLKLSAAVEGRSQSWVIGRARGICLQADAVIGALRDAKRIPRVKVVGAKPKSHP